MWIRRWMCVGGWICGCVSVCISLSLKKGPWLLEQWLQWNYFLTWNLLDAASRCLWRRVWSIDIWLESHLMGWIIDMKLVSCGHKGRLGVLSVGSLRTTLPPVTNLTNTSVVSITIRAEQGSHHFRPFLPASGPAASETRKRNCFLLTGMDLLCPKLDQLVTAGINHWSSRIAKNMTDPIGMI